MMPGSAPSTPASHEPSVLETSPFSYSLVSSPMYQTLPSWSWAYQSNVSSASSPSTYTVSRTTVVETPMTWRRSLVTSTSIRSVSPSSVPS